MRRVSVALASILLIGAAAQLPAPAAAQGTAGWFVVRNPNSFQCWTARLIQISGEYNVGKNLIAGGPFTSKEEATQRLDALRERGTCRSR